MMSRAIDFITGSSWRSHEKDGNGLDLCYAYPSIETDQQTDVVITNDTINPRSQFNVIPSTEDGLYAGSTEPLTRIVVKPYQLDKPNSTRAKQKSCSQLLEIAIRDVKIHPNEIGSDSTMQVTSVAVLYKEKIVCKSTSPFNRQLYKLLLKDSPESTNLSVQVQTQGGASTIVPLPLPKRSVKNSKLEIDFALGHSSGVVHSGTILCTYSLRIEGQEPRCTHTAYLCPTSNDPNDPRNGVSIIHRGRDQKSKDIKYFSIEAPALRFKVSPGKSNNDQIVRRVVPKQPENVLLEQPPFSLGDLSFRDWFQTRHPLRPSSSTHSQKLRSGRKEFLVITALRGVEVPIREESASVQPLLEIEWGENVYATTPADGPAPVWQQTFRFEMPQQSSGQSVKLRLYDQHPVWGLQWLGEARIPMETHRNCQDLERWVGLSPLYSPVRSFGYVQASPGQAYTRIYILMKMEKPGNPKSADNGSIDTLSRTLQRCMVVPYKISGIEDPVGASRLAMLLPSLPLRYGPLTPRQALNLNKVDHYGRAALLASLMQGLDLQSSVLLGTSQTRKWAAYVLTIDESMGTVIWDPENGDHYNPGDNRCSMIKVSRQINHRNVWENMQRAISPVNLKYDTKSTKDWRPVSSSSISNDGRTVQTLELSDILKGQQEEDLPEEIEQHLKEKIAHWRSMECLTTIWNRHAATMLRGFLLKLQDPSKTQPDKKELRQLYRAYHTHGFVLNLRHSSLAELSDQVSSTKIHKTAGPVEYALVCHVQQYIGNAHSLWLAVMVMRSRE